MIDEPGYNSRNKRPNRILIATPFLLLIILSLIPSTVHSQELDPQTEISIKLQTARSAIVIIITIINGYVVWEEFASKALSIGLVMPTKVEFTVFGSGFLVSPNGYIITNGHVINDYDSEFQEVLPLLFDFAQQVAEANYRTTGRMMTPQEFNILFQQIVSAYLGNRLKIQDYKVDVYVGMGKVVSGLGNLPKFMPARIIESRPFEKEDLALLKIEVNNAPSLIVSRQDAPKVGDRVWAIGYPGVVTFNQILSVETIMEPSITGGSVSGYRLKETGVKVLQADVAVTHGNSGGPLVNSQGVVVAVTSFGAADPTDSGRQVPGFNFFVPSSLVWEMMSRNNVDNTQGVVMQYFEDGLRLYYQRHYSAAIEKFRTVKELFPGFPYVDDFISESQAAIARGEDVPLRQFDMTMIGIIAAIALGAGAGGFLLYRSRRNKAIMQQTMPGYEEQPQEPEQVYYSEAGTGQVIADTSHGHGTPGGQDVQVSEHKFCWNCGRRIPGDALVCPYCGARQEE